MNKSVSTKRLFRSLIICITLTGILACDSTPHLPRLAGNAVILSFGDSLTKGTGANDDESYPAILQQMTGRQVINAGIAGELSESGLKRLPGVIDKYSPDLIILCHGGNDILQKKDLNIMAANIREMIRIARDKGLPVILLGVPRPGLFISTAEVYIDIAKTTDIIFVEDLIADVLSDKSMKSDIAHPNGIGYRKIAESLYSLLADSGAI